MKSKKFILLNDVFFFKVFFLKKKIYIEFFYGEKS